MKIKLLLFCALFSFSAAFSQVSDSAYVGFGHKNMIKTNITAYAFKNINLSYERVISKRFSLSATYAVMPTGKIPYVETFLDGDDLGDVKNIEMSYNAFTFEPRFYLGKKGFGRGFYLAPYYRYSKVDFENYNYDFESGGLEIPVVISGNMSGNSFGILIGNQWMLGEKKNWIIDFSIAGGHYGFLNGDLAAKSNIILTPQMQQDLQNELDNLDVPLVKIKATANANGATAKLDGPWAGLRFGLSLGYAF